ncbi:hypothetical protein WHR41_01296 [Cladosporium halotolerans]|uniref:DUF7719 domain-containing protein n=1 Tax=Cladosporium halotolerans TaxID=1052096 RepID=A0AB34L2R0_9PEZI
MSDDQDKPRNRRERRAAAKDSGKTIESPTSTPKIKLAQPDRSGPKSKTLLDLYDEKKSLLEHGQPFAQQHTDGQVRDESGNILEAGLGDGEPIGPVGDAIFWAVCLAMFHFTLDVLTFQQYRQEIEWGPIFRRTGLVLPILWLLIYVMRSPTARKVELLRQVFFLAVGVGAGCYTIHVGNVYDYYAVMKQAPPLGTLWVWSVIEMRLPYALVGVAANLGYMFYKGYGVF